MGVFYLAARARAKHKLGLFGLLCLLSLPFSWCLADQAEHQSSWRTAVVQVLAYKGDELYNQGSGVVVADDGVIITSAHLLEYADKYVVLDSQGQELQAVMVKADAASDMAVLRAASLTSSPLIFSQDAASDKGTLEVAGYWHKTEETPRSTFFGFSNKPKFVAVIVPELKWTKALFDTSQEETGYVKLVTAMGRGGYGAPLVNRCGQLSGVIRSKPGATLKELWRAHTPVGATAVPLSRLESFLASLSISPLKADSPCLSVVEQQKLAEAAKQQEVEAAKKQAKEAEDAAKKAKADADKAKEDTQQERQAREDAEKEREEITTIVADINSNAELIDSENAHIKKQNQTLFWGAVAAIVIGVLIAVLLLIKRRKDLSVASKALLAASASFGDCRFEGRDSSNAPIAFLVLGNDLMQRQNGLVVGRNPELAQVVIADDTVSRQHAQLYVKENYLHIKDMGSTGGTRVNGVAVSEEGAALITGDKVDFGQVQCTLTVLERTKS